MVKMKNRQFEVVYSIFLKLGQTTVPVPRWNIASRIRVLSLLANDLETARKEPKEVLRLMDAREALYKKYGRPSGEFRGMRRYHIPEEHQAEVASGLLKIDMEHAEDLKVEKLHTANIKQLMEEWVQVDIEPIEEEWCGSLITANELVVLISHGLVREPVACTSSGRAKKD